MTPRLTVTENGRTYDRALKDPTYGRRFEEIWVSGFYSDNPRLAAEYRDRVMVLRTRLVPGGKFHEDSPDHPEC